MEELVYMDPWATTDNKVRWRARVGKASFDFYIPKWRVPIPWPKYIVVSVGEDALPPALSSANIGDLSEPISVVVDRTREHTKTVRYTPRGDDRKWEIGELYIPYILLPPGAPESVLVKVRWDYSHGTMSAPE